MNKLKCTGTPICLCSECYIKHDLKYSKSQLRSDCDACYIQLCPLLNEYLEHYCGEHVPAPPPKVISQHKNKADTGTEYAFTLNMPPNYTTKEAMIKAAESILSHGLTPSAPYEKASHGAYVVEMTEVGTPHIHGVYKTPSGRRISSKYFQRYWKLWDEKKRMGHGHQGGYHQKARHAESYSAYMSKEGVVVPVGPTPESPAFSSPDLISHA